MTLIKKIGGICLLMGITSLSSAQNSLFIGAGIQDFSLTEQDLYSVQQLVKEQGTIPTIIYGLDWPINPKFHLQGQVQQSYGVIPYDGQTQSGIPHRSETTHYLTQGMASIGFLPIKESEIYLGLHGQENIRNVANKNNVYGATETYDEFFAKVGLRQQIIKTARQQLHIWAEFHELLYAQSMVDSRTSDDVTLELKKGKAQAWGFDYLYHYNPKTDWFIRGTSFSHHYQESSVADKTINGQQTNYYLYQPPIYFKQHSLYAGISWRFE